MSEPRTLTDTDIDFLTKALEKSPILHELCTTYQVAFFERTLFLSLDKGDDLVIRGEGVAFFFIVEKGVLQSDDGTELYGAGSAFDEGLVLSSKMRPCTILSVEDNTMVWAIPRSVIDELKKRLQTERQLANRRFLDEIDSFRMLTSTQKDLICFVMMEERYEAGTTVVKEGERGDSLFIVKEGHLDVITSAENKVVKTLGPGEYFGERALIYDEPRSATVVATTSVVTCKLWREIIRHLLGNLQMLLLRNVLLSSLQKSAVLQRLEEAGQEELVSECLVMDVPAKGIILKGEKKLRGVRFIVIVDGVVEVESVPGARVRNGAFPAGILTCTRGDSFGDYYLRYPDEPFQHKVTAKTEAKIALFPSTIMRTVFKKHFALRMVANKMGSNGNSGSQRMSASSDPQALARSLDAAELKKALRIVPILKSLSDSQLEMMCRGSQFLIKIRSQVLMTEGEESTDGIYVIASGEVGVQKNAKVVRTLGKLKYFGERGLVLNEKRSATVAVTSEVALLWMIKKDFFLAIMSRNQEAMVGLKRRILWQDCDLKISDLKHVRISGCGSFGFVVIVEATLKISDDPKTIEDVDMFKLSQQPERFALKGISRENIKRTNSKDATVYEKNILADNDHPMLLRLIKTMKDEDFIYYLTEACEGGDLFDIIYAGINDDEPYKCITIEAVQFYLGSLVLGLEDLHLRNIIYRDLKPENIMLDASGYVKIIDFGCSKKLERNQRAVTLIGTPNYMAPEMFERKVGYGHAIDLWALGVLMYQIVYREFPFGEDMDACADPEQFAEEIKNKPLSFPHTPLFPKLDTPETRSLIEGLLTKDPNRRIGSNLSGFDAIKKHSFFKTFSFNALLERQIPAPHVQHSFAFDESNNDDMETYNRLKSANGSRARLGSLKLGSSWDENF